MIDKNIQVIDGAENCAYDIFTATESDFKLIYPGPQQDIEFVDDFFERVGDEVASSVLDRLWKKRVDKKSVAGIHGTLFFGLNEKRKYYPNKRDDDAIANP